MNLEAIVNKAKRSILLTGAGFYLIVNTIGCNSAIDNPVSTPSPENTRPVAIRVYTPTETLTPTKKPTSTPTYEPTATPYPVLEVFITNLPSSSLNP